MANEEIIAKEDNAENSEEALNSANDADKTDTQNLPEATENATDNESAANRENEAAATSENDGQEELSEVSVSSYEPLAKSIIDGSEPEQHYDSFSSDEEDFDEFPLEEKSQDDILDEEASDDSSPSDDMYYLPFEFQESEKEKENENSKVDEEKEQEPYNPEKPRKVDGRFDFVELFVFTLAIVMIITSFFFRHSIVEGPSMENTLFEGEHLILSNLFYTPERGDIIVCEDYSTSIHKPIVKRVIAVGGDKIKITASGKIYVNDRLIIEEYVFINEKNYEYDELELVVPDGELFVMGDHRNESTDSRERTVGTVSEDSVLGRVLFRFYPFERFGAVD